MQLNGKSIMLAGLKGDKGDIPEVEIGEVDTLAAGSQATASVTGSGTEQDPVKINLGIPKGDKGDKGEKGDKGDKGDTGDIGNDPNAVHFTEQTLTVEQKTQARANIAAANDGEVVKIVAQTLTPEQQAQAIANIGAQAANLQFKNVQVPANSFVADTTYDDYPFRAAIALSGVTSTMAPSVCFGVAQATSGDYAPVADSYNGGVYLYAKKTNEALFSIPYISLEVTE